MWPRTVILPASGPMASAMSFEQRACVGREHGGAEREHREIGIVDQVDPDALGGVDQPDLAHQAAQPGAVASSLTWARSVSCA